MCSKKQKNYGKASKFIHSPVHLLIHSVVQLISHMAAVQGIKSSVNVHVKPQNGEDVIFQGGMVVGAKQAGLSVSETHTFTQDGAKTSTEWQFFG